MNIEMRVPISFVRTGWLLLPFAVLMGCANPDSLPDNFNNEENEGLASSEVRLSLSPGEKSLIQESKAIQKRAIDLAAAKKTVDRIMAKYLFDPSSAIYADIKLGRDSSICGKFNAKNRYGAYVGFKDFVIDKSQNLETSQYNNGLETDTSSSFAYSYLALCADEDERKRHIEMTQPSDISDYSPSSPQPETSPENEPDAILDAPTREEDGDIPVTIS